MIVLGKKIAEGLAKRSAGGLLAELEAASQLTPEGHFVLPKQKLREIWGRIGDGKELPFAAEQPRPEIRPHGDHLEAAAPKQELSEGVKQWAAAKFAEAIERWIRAGRPVAPKAVRAERYSICLACEFWDPKGWMGIGKCLKCGCSRLKLSLATERCPLKPPKWDRVDVPR